MSSREKIIACALAAVFCCSLHAQAPALGGVAKAASSQSKTEDPLNRDSPQSSITAFLEAYHSKDYARAARYLNLRNLPEAQRRAEGPELARQFGAILDQDFRFDVGSLSRMPEGDPENGSSIRQHLDTFTVAGREVNLDLERVTLKSGIAVWVLASDSVPLLGQVNLQMSESPVERHLPAPLVAWKLLDTPVWRWIGLLILAVALAVASKLASRFVLELAEPALRKVAPRVNWTRLELFLGPVRALLALVLFRAGMAAMEPAALPRLYLERILTLLFYFAVAWLCARAIDLVALHLRSTMGPRFLAMSRSLLPVSTRVIKLAILVLALTSTLDNWGYNTRTILATLGLGGLAIALAAQKTVENLFGGVAVISDRPVMVGDYCKFGTQSGTVEDIGLRSTRIRTSDRTLITVPNAQFSTMTIENFSRRDKLFLSFALNLKRSTTPEQVRKVLNSIQSILKDGKLETGAVPVRFAGLGTYSLDLEVEAYVPTQDYDEFLRIRQDLLLRILDAVASAGTALAVPTQATISDSGASDSAPPPPRDLALNGR